MEQFKGYKRCPKWLKQRFREATRFICQICNQHESTVGTLQIHRCIRGTSGGLYTVMPLRSQGNNCMVLCDSCHKKMHVRDNKKVGYQ